MFDLDQYRASRTNAAVTLRSDRALLGVQGADRASFLHSLLSNDIEHLERSGGCYATLLTPQGRMISDMIVMNAGPDMLLDVPRATHDRLLSRLDRSIFSEDVRVVDRSVALTSIGVYGPHAVSMVSGALEASGARASHDDPSPEGPMGSWHEYQHRQYMLDGQPILVMRDNELGAGGYAFWLPAEHAAMFKASFEAFGALEMSPETADTLRIEAGRPRWGNELDEDTIPLEAGIEDRAISFTKGCYVGQEVIVRILHRGHGRVARRLVGLTVAAEIVVPRDAVVYADDKEAGRVTSAAMSPAAGSIALAYVHREFAVPGTPLSIAVNADRVSAVVAPLPFVAPGGLMLPLVTVVAAVIEQDGRLLVTRRPPGVHLAGYWEFPGGKVQDGEDLQPALIREILEELDCRAIVGDEVFATTHTYPDRRVRLSFHRCVLEGEPRPQLGQDLRWVSRAELGSLTFPPADKELVELLAAGRIA